MVVDEVASRAWPKIEASGLPPKAAGPAVMVSRRDGFREELLETIKRPGRRIISIAWRGV